MISCGAAGIVIALSTVLAGIGTVSLAILGLSKSKKFTHAVTQLLTLPNTLRKTFCMSVIAKHSVLGGRGRALGIGLSISFNYWPQKRNGGGRSPLVRGWKARLVKTVPCNGGSAERK